MWGTTGLGINVQKVRAALGDDVELDSWALLFDPANAAKLAACGISVLDDEQEAFAAALIFRGRDANAITGDETQVVSDTFAAIRPHIRYFHSSKYIDDLANGDICLAMGYSGDIFLAADRAAESENGVEIQFILPREGAVRWFDLVAIPADAPNKANAHAFINYLMEPQVAAGITNYVAYASPNTAASEFIDEEISSDPAIYPSAEVLATLVDPITHDPEVTRERVRAWTTIKTGK
jgi:putrescine transport system substrate-binding protein